MNKSRLEYPSLSFRITSQCVLAQTLQISYLPSPATQTLEISNTEEQETCHREFIVKQTRSPWVVFIMTHLICFVHDLQFISNIRFPGFRNFYKLEKKVSSLPEVIHLPCYQRHNTVLAVQNEFTI